MLQSNFFLNLDNVNYIEDLSFYETFLLRKFPGGETTRKKKINLFKKQLSSYQINLLSSEHFSMPSSWLNKDIRKFYSRNNISYNLKKYFPGAKIILIIRKQRDWIESWYQERIKRNEYRKIDDLLESKFFQNEIKQYLDYDKTYSHYLKHFGKNNVLVIPMEIILKNPQEFSNQITDFLQIERIKIRSFPVHRSSQSFLLTELKRLINLFLNTFKFKKEDFFSNFILKLYKILSSNLFFLSKFFRPTRLTELHKNLFSEFKDKNKTLDKKLNKNLYKYGYY